MDASNSSRCLEDDLTTLVASILPSLRIPPHLIGLGTVRSMNLAILVSRQPTAHKFNRAPEPSFSKLVFMKVCQRSPASPTGPRIPS
jgi:hypothetical protein